MTYCVVNAITGKRNIIAYAVVTDGEEIARFKCGRNWRAAQRAANEMRDAFVRRQAAYEAANEKWPLPISEPSR